MVVPHSGAEADFTVRAFVIERQLLSSLLRQNVYRHRASASEVSKVKNARPDASVHGFVRRFFVLGRCPRGITGAIKGVFVVPENVRETIIRGDRLVDYFAKFAHRKFSLIALRSRSK